MVSMGFARSFHALFTLQNGPNKSRQWSRIRMLQILQFANRCDLLADACFSFYTGFPPTLHSNTSAQTALGLSQHGCIIHSLDVKQFVAR